MLLAQPTEHHREGLAVLVLLVQLGLHSHQPLVDGIAGIGKLYSRVVIAQQICKRRVPIDCAVLLARPTCRVATSGRCSRRS